MRFEVFTATEIYVVPVGGEAVRVLQNVDNHLPDCTVLQSGRLELWAEEMKRVSYVGDGLRRWSAAATRSGPRKSLLGFVGHCLTVTHQCCCLQALLVPLPAAVSADPWSKCRLNKSLFIPPPHNFSYSKSSCLGPGVAQ